MSTWDSAHLAMKQNVINDPEYLNKILDTIESAGNNINDRTELNFIKTNLKEISNDELFSLVEIFIQKQSFLYTKGTVFSILDYGQYRFVEGNLNQIFSTKLQNQSEREEAFEVFTTPTIDSFQLQHERELKEIIIPYLKYNDFVKEVLNNNTDYIKTFHPDFWNEIVQHTKKYNWLFYSYMGPAYTEKEFIDIVRDMISDKSNLIDEIKTHEENNASIILNRRKIVEKINPTSFESQILDIAEKMVWAKPRRKDYQSKSYYHLSFLLKEIANRLNLTLDEVFFCSIQMLKDGLNGYHIDKKAIELVKKLHIIIPSEDGAVEVFTGIEAESFLENSIEQKEKIQNT